MTNFTNNNFRGILNGKHISNFKIQKEAYNIDRSDERIKYINKILNTNSDMGYDTYDEYFDNLFTQTSDIALDKDGVYKIEDDGNVRYADYDEYISWCKETDNDPIEYADISTPFESINSKSNGEWKYTGQNTSNVKLVLNKSDDLYSTSNIACELEKLGSYILNSKVYIDKNGNEINKDGDIKYKIYSDKEMFARACKEYNFINNSMRCNGNHSNIGNDKMEGEAFPIFQSHKQNFNKVKTVKFLGVSDFEKYPILKDYHNLHMYLKDKLNDSSINNKLKNKMAYAIKGVKNDLDDVKLALMKPIIFKSPLTPIPVSECKDIVIPLKDEVIPLLQYKYDDINDVDKICCVLDIKNILKKCKFTNKQIRVLYRWINDYNVNDIANELHMTHVQVNSTLKSISNRIIKKYEEQYEDWIGFNYKRSEWKKCSKCGESKLLKRFDKKGKQGLQSMCKECRSV